MDEQKLRPQLNTWLEAVAMQLNFQEKSILEVGIAGDEKPSGSHRFFGNGNQWTTMDKEPKWEPDIVADLQTGKFGEDIYDAIIMTQSLEHIWHYNDALRNLHKMTRDYLIIDCPFKYAFHQDHLRPEKDFRLWDDYWRFTPAALYRILIDSGFEEVEITASPYNTMAVCRKKRTNN